MKIFSAAAVLTSAPVHANSLPKLDGQYLYTDTQMCTPTNVYEQDTGILTFHSDTKTFDVHETNIRNSSGNPPIVNVFNQQGLPFKIKSETEMNFWGARNAYVFFGPQENGVALSALITLADLVRGCGMQYSLTRKGS